MNSTYTSLANGIKFTYSAVIIFFNIAHNDTWWHVGKLQQRSPWQSGSGILSNLSCFLVSIQASGCSDATLCNITLNLSVTYVGQRSLRSRPCFFLIINRKYLEPVRPLSQTIVMFSSEILVMDSEVFNLLFGKSRRLLRVRVIFELCAF